MRAMVTTKRCSRCKHEKPLVEFYVVRGVPSPRCKACQLDASAEYVARHPGRRRATAQRSRFRKILKTYGLTEGQFDGLVLAQGGRCAVCEEPEPELQIDHCHVTKRVRGLLCPECNKALGLFYDDIPTIERALRYLAQ